MGVSTDYTRVLRTDGSGHFIVFLTHSTVSYVNSHNDPHHVQKHCTVGISKYILHINEI
jgi:hypothetical protein